MQNIAYDKDLQVAGGLTLSKSSGNLGVGVAGSYLTANNDIKAAISGSTLKQMANVDNLAGTHLVQVGAAISAGRSPANRLTV
ncbi:MAG: hypothetical protein LKE29_02700 [Acidaminococcaceae bacterium]|nr:hypothetical protein [Acidaminococcaceae bacterium]